MRGKGIILKNVLVMTLIFVLMTSIVPSGIVAVQEGSDDGGLTNRTDDVVPSPTPTLAGAGLVAYFPFEGDIVDQSGNGNNGTNHNATFVAGYSGQGLCFDGVDNYVSAPININPDVMPQMTMIAWARSNSDLEGTVISCDDGGFDRTIKIDSRGGGTGWSAFCGSNGILGYSPVTIGDWFFLAAVYDQDAETVKLYVDGTLINEGEGKLESGWDYIRIGSNPSFGRYFNGTIDEIRIYNYALSADDVKAIYEGKEPSAPIQTPEPTSGEEVIPFEEDFDDGYAQEFGNEVGDWEVQLLDPKDGKYTATTGAYRFSTAGDPNWQDYVIEADFINAKDGGFLVRAQDHNNGIVLIARPTMNDIYWQVRKNGFWDAKYGYTTLGHEVGENLHVTVEVSGNEFKAYVNDELKTAFNSTKCPKGKIGLYLSHQSDQYWDNVIVCSLAAVTLDFTIGISAPTMETSVGGCITYDVELKNRQKTADRFHIHVAGIDPGWFTIDSSCMLTAGEKKELPLTLAIPKDASGGEFTVVVNATSSNLGLTKAASKPLRVSLEPLISDLSPANGTHTGSSDVLISWKTSVECSSEVFIKPEGVADYTTVTGDQDVSHFVSVTNLTRNAWYEFYVRSQTDQYSAESEVRRIFIDNGIAFSKRTYEFGIERDYDQRVTIAVKNTDDEPHELLLSVSNVPEDLVVGFVGEGSMDQVISLHPGEGKDVLLVIHAPDAISEDYSLLLDLTNLGKEELHDYAYLKLHVHFPVIDFTIEELGSDPFTLAKSLKVTNHGDPITDLSITADENLVNILAFQPSISHGYLGTGSSVEFKAIPVLSTNFTNISGDIIVTGSRENVSITVDFEVPEGKAIYICSVPTTDISFASEFDEDELAITNPTADDLVPSYIVKGTTLFMGSVIVTVLQDGEPACDALVKLKMWNSETETISEAWTDRWGHALFIIYGHASTFNYYAELPGYDLSTETRTFTVNATPAFELTQDISWVSISDTNSTFNFPREDSFITLDAAPYAFEAFKENLAYSTTAILYLQPYVAPEEPEVVRIALRMTTIEILGNITGDTIQFNVDGVPPGNYTAAIFAYSPTEISMSESLNLSITDDPWQRGALNFAIQVPLALNSTHFYDTSVIQEVIEEDPNRIIDLWYVQPANSTTMLLLTYMIRTTEDRVDTAVIEARDSNGEVFYSEIRTVTLEKDKIQLLNVYLPAYEENRIKEGFTVELKMRRSEEGHIHLLQYGPPTGHIGIKVYDGGNPIDGVIGKEAVSVFPLKWVKTSETLTDEQALALTKCAAGFIPYVGLAITAYDFSKAIYQSEFIKASGSAGAIALDDVSLKLVTKAVMKGGYKVGVRGALKAGAKWIPFAGSLYGCWDDFNSAIKENNANIQPHGVIVNIEKCDWYCTNKPKVETSFTMPSYIHSPGVLDPFNGQWYYRSLPAHLTVRFTLPWSRDAYNPHDVHIYINDVEIGKLIDTIPEGVYTFDFDPQILNFADTGLAINTIRLDTYHMNGGHYVITGEYTITCDLRQVAMPIVAASQAEADQAVKEYFEGVGNLPDLAMYPEEVTFYSETPLVGETIDVAANVYNFGTITEDVKVRFTFSGPATETSNTTIHYIPSTGNATANVYWSPMAQGTYTIKVTVNPDQEINESDYTNNEATKTITVTGSDTTPPIISNPQPPDGAITSDNMTLISADLADADSGVNTNAVRLVVDGTDVTQSANAISSCIWYTPEHALTAGVHNVSVYAADNEGNQNSLNWSFTVQTGIASYDLNGDSIIDKEEALKAVSDYLVYNKISKDLAIEVVKEYLLNPGLVFAQAEGTSMREVSNSNPDPGEVVTVAIKSQGIGGFYAVKEDIDGLEYIGEHTADSKEPEEMIFIMLQAKGFNYTVKVPEAAKPGDELVITGKFWNDPAAKKEIGKTVLKVAGAPPLGMAISREVRNEEPSPGEVVTVSLEPSEIETFYAVKEDIDGLEYIGEHTADSKEPEEMIFIMLQAKGFNYTVKVPDAAKPGDEFVITGKFWNDPAAKKEIGKTVLKVADASQIN